MDASIHVYSSTGGLSDEQGNHVAAETLYPLEHVAEIVRSYVDDHGGYASRLELSDILSSFLWGARE